MKKVFVLSLLILGSLATSAQELSLETMEKKAKEMVRVISLSDRNEYRKFIKENYSQALIDKPLRRRVQEGDGSSPTETKGADNLEGKVAMYEMLHKDVGNGKILSMKRDGDKLTVEVAAETGANMSFGITFSKTEPFLIDAVSIQMVMGR